MTETTFALCKTIFPGVAMWLAGVCASNQALDAPVVNLASPGVILQQVISIPMDEQYSFGVQFRFPTKAAYESTTIAGQPNATNPQTCTDAERYAQLTPEEKKAVGAALELELVVSSLSGSVITSGRYSSRCLQSWGSLTKSRHFGSIALNKGNYRIQVINHAPVRTEDGVVSTLFLVGAGAGYP